MTLLRQLCSGAGLPASLALASPLSFPERPSQHPSTHLSEFFSKVSLSFRRAVAASSSPSTGYSQFRFQSLEHSYRLRPWSSTQFEADRIHRVRADLAPVPVRFSFSPSHPEEQEDSPRVAALNIRGCSWSSDGYHQRQLHTFFEFVLQHCRAHCRVFVCSKGFF